MKKYVALITILTIFVFCIIDSYAQNSDTKRNLRYALIGYSCSFSSAIVDIKKTSSHFGVESVSYNFSYNDSKAFTGWSKSYHQNNSKLRFKVTFVIRAFRYGITTEPCSQKYVVYGALEGQIYDDGKYNGWRYISQSKLLNKKRSEFFDLLKAELQNKFI